MFADLPKSLAPTWFKGAALSQSKTTEKIITTLQPQQQQPPELNLVL